MKSPFPGMDPYLEARWGSVHQRLITYAADAISEQLPPDLRARTEERVYVQAESEVIRRVVPDVYVAQYKVAAKGSSHLAERGGQAVAEPMEFVVEDEEITEGFIEIRESGGGKLVTVIEFLSPANKVSGEGQKLYLQKQNELLHSDTNLVEIDLLRCGQRVIAFPEYRIPSQNRRDYLVCVRCGWRENKRSIYAMSLRERLPRIAIPLRKKDQSLPLDLQALLDQCYHNGRYDDIDYRSEPVPPFDAEEKEWADQALKSAGKR